MLNFFINRAGASLNPTRRRILERAKQELREVFAQRGRGHAPAPRLARPLHDASRVRNHSRGVHAMAKYGSKAKQTVSSAMRRRKRGTLTSGRSGKKVTSHKQAIAIGLSEARRKGAKVPPNPNRPASKKSAGRASGKRRSTRSTSRGK
jgi:hypothetical protein